MTDTDQDVLLAPKLANVNSQAPDRPSLDEIHSLIQQFGPLVRLHPDEKYLMDEPEALLATGQCALVAGLVQNETSYDGFTQTILSSEAVSSGRTLLDAVARAKQGPQAGNRAFRYWLNIPDSLKPGNMARAKAQVRVKAWAQGGIDLQFWFFYGFNGPGKFQVKFSHQEEPQRYELDSIGRHYGDWEHVTIRLARPQPSAPWQLRNVYLSRHDFTIWANVLSQLQIVGQHPVVYAARDSHAHYIDPGLHLYERLSKTDAGVTTATVDAYDLTADGGIQFEAWKPEHYAIIASDFAEHDVSSPAWASFDSRWGQYEKLSYTYHLTFAGATVYSHPYETVESGPSGPLQHDPGGGLAAEWASDNMGQGYGALSWLVGDIAGDGKSKIIQPWGNGSRLGMIVYGGDGFGGLTQTWATDNMDDNGPGAVTWLAADIDGDRKTEIIQGWRNGSSLGFIVYGSDGRGGLTTLWGTGDMGQGPGALTWLLADVNGDGKPEIVQPWANGSSLGLIVYGSDGGKGLRCLWGTSDVGQGPGAVAWLVGDFNGDGRDEIVQAWANHDSLGFITYGSKDSQDKNELKVLWSTDNMQQGPGAVTWQAADINGDGKTEIIQGWANGSQLGFIVYGSDGRGGLKVLSATDHTGDEGPGAVAWQVGDFSGSGKPELLQLWANNGFNLAMILYGSDGKDGLTKLWGSPDLGEGPGALAWLQGRFNGLDNQLVQAWKSGSNLGLIAYSKSTE
ncbi:Vps62-related protein [Bradyrhizobium sp. BR 10289]|nr:Vps62-related protein [Bradyrhizobium sp. BR 10289]